MSANKKNKCICEVCGELFRSKEKFKKLCPLHNKKNEEKIKQGEEKKDENRGKQVDEFIKRIGL